MNKTEYEDRTKLLVESLEDEYSRFVSPYVLKDYKLAERRIVFNDHDTDLYPIPVDIPEPPPYHTIDGFGLPAREQYFRNPADPRSPNRFPEALTKLMKELGSNASILDIYHALDLNRVLYKDIIRWINLQWHYRLNGYWFFNNGFPTYIDGWHWFYISYWNIDNDGCPEYRYRDRMFFIFARYCFTTTLAPYFFRVMFDGEYEYFYDRKEAERFIADNGLLLRPEHGEYMVDVGTRTIFGFNYPKHRREGATAKAAMINYELTSRIKSVHGAIQSKDEASAKKDVYEAKIIKPFKRVPFFFKPFHKSRYASELVFDMFGSTTNDGGAASTELGLESDITYRSAGERQYDGSKLIAHHGDEVGKQGEKPYNSILRHNVIKKCLAQGDKIHGIEMNTSTVSDTSGEAGHNFMRLCKISKWEKRLSRTGRTESGLISLFIPAQVNYDGFSDRHGNPVINKPNTEQRKDIGKRYGALDWLHSELEASADDPISYYETMREFPTKFRHAFLSAGKDSGFDLKVLSETITELELTEDKTPRRLNLDWVDKHGGDVKFIDNPNGRFEISYIPAIPNNYTKDKGKKVPANTHIFVSSADPFKFEKTNNGKKSDGAGCVYLKHDPQIDTKDIDVAQHQTNRAVCTYLNRVDTTNEYCEDMLKMCIYFGTKIFPENNVNSIYEYFRDYGFEEYLQYKHTKGKRDANPGFFSDQYQKQLLFSLMMNKIHDYGRNERHVTLLREVMEIQGLTDMTNYDLFTAYGGCLLAIYYENEGKTKVEGIVDEDSYTKFMTGDY